MIYKIFNKKTFKDIVFEYKLERKQSFENVLVMHLYHMSWNHFMLFSILL